MEAFIVEGVCIRPENIKAANAAEINKRLLSGAEMFIQHYEGNSNWTEVYEYFKTVIKEAHATEGI